MTRGTELTIVTLLGASFSVLCGISWTLHSILEELRKPNVPPPRADHH